MISPAIMPGSGVTYTVARDPERLEAIQNPQHNVRRLKLAASDRVQQVHCATVVATKNTAEEGVRIAPVKAAENGPVARHDLHRLDEVLVARQFDEPEAGAGIPVATGEPLVFEIWQEAEPDFVFRVGRHECRVVAQRGLDEGPRDGGAVLALLIALVEWDGDWCAVVRAARDEAAFEPVMAWPAGVGACAHHADETGRAHAVSAHQKEPDSLFR